MKKKEKNFSVEIIQETDGKSYYVVVPSLPGCFSQGKTIEEAKENIAEAIEFHLKELRSPSP